MKEKIATLILYAAFFVVLWLALIVWSNYSFKRTEGPEMSPAIRKEQFKFIQKPSNRTDAFSRNDIVAFTFEGIDIQTRAFYTARVVGFPGERVALVNGDLRIDGKSVGQPYLSPGAQSNDTVEEVVVPRGHLYLLYDFRSFNFRSSLGYRAYMDSRTLGPIGVWTIIAKF
jgi:signal peptidase I